MSSIIVQLAEYTRLCREYSDLPLNADTPEEYEPIERMRRELKQQIVAIRQVIDKIEKG